MPNKTTDAIHERLVSGTRLLQRGQTGDAVELLEEALEMDADHIDVALNLSAAYILARRFREAVPILEQLAERLPDNAMVWTNLGAAHLGNPVTATDARRQRAIEAFKRALAADPDAPNVAYNIGLIHKDRRDVPKAIAWFERALETNPADKDAQHWIDQLSTGESE